jgi:hypothetical protein
MTGLGCNVVGGNWECFVGLMRGKVSGPQSEDSNLVKAGFRVLNELARFLSLLAFFSLPPSPPATPDTF